MKGNKRRVLSILMAWAIILSTFSAGFAPLQAYAKDSADPQLQAEEIAKDSEEALENKAGKENLPEDDGEDPLDEKEDDEGLQVEVEEETLEGASEDDLLEKGLEETPLSEGAEEDSAEQDSAEQDTAEQDTTGELFGEGAPDRMYAHGRNNEPYRLLDPPAPIENGSMTVAFDVSTKINNPNTCIGLVADTASNTTDTPGMNAIVRFANNKIDTYDNNKWSSLSAPFASDKVYRVQITVHMDSQTYDAWVTDEAGESTQIAASNRFRAKNPANIGKIGIVDTRGANNEYEDLWVENFEISQDTVLKVLLDGRPYENHGKTFTLRQGGEVKYTGTGSDEIITFGSVEDGTYQVYVDGTDTGEVMIVSGTGYLELELGTVENALKKDIKDLIETIKRRKLKEDYYTPESWTALTEKLQAATDILEEINPTEAELQTALDDLQAAYDGLMEKERAHGIYKAAYADFFGDTQVRSGLGNTSDGASFSNGSYSDPGDGKGREVVGEFHTGSDAANYEGKPGAGITFPFTVHEDGEYGFLLRFSRINYEIEDYISVYVNYDQVPKNADGSPSEPGVYRIPLTGRDSELVFVDSDQWTLELEQGDTISLVLDTSSDASGAKVDKGLVNIDYLSVWEVEEPYVYDDFNRTFYLLLDNTTTNDNITIPEPDFTPSLWESSDPAVATVDASTGEIAPVSAGFTVVTATGLKNGETVKINYSIYVKTEESELALESGLVALYDIENNRYMPEAKVGAAGDVKGFIPIRTSGFSATKEDGTPAVDGVDRVGSGYVDTLDHCPVGATITAEVPSVVNKAGLYDVHLNYGKGSAQSTGKLGLLVNDQMAGTLFIRSTTSMNVAKSNAVTVYLEPGDTIGVQTIVNSRDSIGRFNSLTITENVIIPPSVINLPATKAIEHQEQAQLDVTTVPENATWSFDWSSDTENVVLHGSLLIGQNVGLATITAQSIYNANVKASTDVTVSENESIFPLKSDSMTVYLDKDFPRAVQYIMDSGKKMEGNRTKLDTIRLTTDYTYKLNTTQGPTGSTVEDYQPTVECSVVGTDESGNEFVDYTLTVSELSVVIKIRVTVDDNVLKFDFIEIDDEENKVYVIELPDHNPVTVSNVEEDASFAGSKMESNITRSGDTHFAIADATEGVNDYLYAFVSNGEVAAGIKSNAFGISDVKRVLADSKINGDYKTTSLRSGSWVWRFPDATKKFVDWEGRYGEEQELITKTYYDEPYTNPVYDNGLPHFWVVLAEENNGDSRVDWQDAANAFRDIAKQPVGSEKIADAVVQRLIMSQGNETNYPYLASLDETKRIAAHTDGLGQIILQKYHNAGNWGDFSVYDDQLGGLAEFNEFTTSATHDYNSFVGVHTNWTEYFAKVKQFSYENVEMQDDGITPRSKGYVAFGYYLHQCYVVDDQIDALTRDIAHDLSRYQRMNQFKTDIPDLGFIYSDVYSHNGWRGKELSRDYEDNGLAQFVEWPYVAEDDAVWAHWAVEKSYSPASLKGYSSDIARFIFNDTKDRWDNYATNNWKSGIEETRAPSSAFLLMGADTTSYEGWVHNGINEYDSIIEKIYRNNIPAKYMQHFPIKSMESNDDGWANYISFEDGVEVYSTNRGPNLDPRSGSRIIEKDGKKVYEQACVIGHDNGPVQYLIPWDEGDMYKDNADEEKEIKLYHWNDNGGSTTWELPDRWNDVGSTIYLYELTDQGKIEEQALTVSGGQVTINAKAKTPYVVYKTRADLAEDKEIFKGKFDLTNPGFSAGFDNNEIPGWTMTKGAAEAVRNDNTTMTTFNVYGTPTTQFNNRSRNWELAFKTSGESEVQQTITDLVPGKEYAVSVMVEVERDKTREATLFVDNGGETHSNFTDASILINYDSYDSKARTSMLRMRVVFTATAETADIRLHAAAGNGEVRFDNVRVYETTTPRPEQAVTDGAIVLYQDFESAPTGETGGSGLEINKPTYEGFFPFNLGNGGGFREARTIMQRRHDPYTQNNTVPNWTEKAPDSVRNYTQPTPDQDGNIVQGQWWDTTTIPVDLVVDGERSFSNITGSSGLMYQTTPQSIRFEEGKTYRISFDYQTGINGIFAFVLGEGAEGTYHQTHTSTTVDFTGKKHAEYLQGTMGPYFDAVVSDQGNPITAMPAGWSPTSTYRNANTLSTAVPNWRGNYEYTFTSTDDQTWFGIFRNSDSPQPGENPNPFIIDNLLIVEVGGAVSGDATLTSGSLAGTALQGQSFAGGTTIADSSELTVTIPDTVSTDAALVLNKGDSNASIRWVKGEMPTGDGDYTQGYPAENKVTVTDGDILWIQVKAADGTTLYYKITVTVTALESLTVALTSGDSKITLAPQQEEIGYTYYYTTSTDSVTAPALDDLIGTISGATSYATAIDIAGTSGVPIYVQVYKVAIDDTIKGYGETFATPDVSNDATLSNLSISTGTLSPAFAPEVLSYTATVPNAVDSLAITATANHSAATLAGEGTKALAVGKNIFTVTVTAADGNERSYVITVTREGTLPTTTYTVTFDSNGGSVVPAQTVDVGTTAVRPQNPTRSGYTFAGWRKGSASGQEYDFDALITGHITLVARWDKVSSADKGDTSTTGDKETTRGGSFGDWLKSFLPPKAKEKWLGASDAAKQAEESKAQGQETLRTRHQGKYGVKGDAWAGLAGLRYQHDTMKGTAVQMRIYIDTPEQRQKDTVLSGYVEGTSVDRIQKIFNKWFKNIVSVVVFDQEEDWEQPLRLAVKVDLKDMDQSQLVFYSYNEKTNSYRQITDPAFAVDSNGYLHFTTPYAGAIVISEGKLELK